MTQEIVPDGLSAAGRALWDSIVGTYDLDPHERQALIQAARCADRLAALHEIVDREGVTTLDERRGIEIAHPALVEARQQQITQVRLMTALRLPDSDGVRPQHRGVRGAYRLRAAGNE
ncbi:MAG TPA: hypothetical protein VGH99_11730 [Pseudonocardia sp.]